MEIPDFFCTVCGCKMQITYRKDISEFDPTNGLKKEAFYYGLQCPNNNLISIFKWIFLRGALHDSKMGYDTSEDFYGTDYSKCDCDY